MARHSGVPFDEIGIQEAVELPRDLRRPLVRLEQPAQLLLAANVVQGNRVGRLRLAVLLGLWASPAADSPFLGEAGNGGSQEGLLKRVR